MDIDGDGSITMAEAIQFWKAALPDAAIPETPAVRFGLFIPATSGAAPAVSAGHFAMRPEQVRPGQG